MLDTFNIAIDGPAGAGKSTIARLIAAKLGFIYVDTGAMYRAIALHLIQKGIQANEETEIGKACKEVSITIRYRDQIQFVLLNGNDVSELIRREEVGNMASLVSVYLPVREKLLELQRNLAATENVIMDGRDIGTYVLPKADVKIYLTAKSSVRAERRYRELAEKGIMCNLEEIEQDIRERDYRDMHREHAPLKQAEDAVLLDASEMTVTQVADAIVKIAVSRGLKV